MLTSRPIRVWTALASLALFTTFSFAAHAGEDEQPPLPTSEAATLPGDELQQRTASPSPSPSSSAEHRSGARPKHCVGWAVVGVLGGSAVGALSVAVVAGKQIYHPAGSTAAVVLQNVGAIAGPIVTCRMSEDPRIVPAASFVYGGVVAGGVAVGLPAYLVLQASTDKTDNIGWSGLAFAVGIAAGATLGGYLGWLVSEAREPASMRSPSPSARPGMRWGVSPYVAKETGGVSLGGTF